MNLELDRYYTPLDLAESVLRDEYKFDHCVAIDTTCGEGNLLHAACRVFKSVSCVGIDKDKSAIRKLRKNRPNWELSTADLLKETSYSRASVISQSQRDDGLLVLNPPFSHGKHKSIPVTYAGESFKSSVAMAYILRSFDLFRPERGAMIIVPESVLYSETDQCARTKLEKKYQINLISELDNTTFSGARVRSSVIKIEPAKKKKVGGFCSNTFSQRRETVTGKIGLIRGAMPMHEAVFSKSNKSTSLIHSTDLKSLHIDGSLKLPRVKHTKKGLVSGYVLLIPRVGLPNIDYVKVLYFDEDVQLSDCVIALKFESMASAKRIEKYVKTYFFDFVNLYRGTGARYVTMKRLSQWFGVSNLL